MIKVTLLVKEGPAAETQLIARLNAWMAEGPHNPPFPGGTLLTYTIHPQPIEMERSGYEPS